MISRAGTLTIRVANPALTDLEIQRAEIIAKGVVTTRARLAGVPLEAVPTLAARRYQDLEVHYRVVDCAIASASSGWKLAVTAQTALGLTRTITVPIWFASACCPPTFPPRAPG